MSEMEFRLLFFFYIHKTKSTSERLVYFGRYTTTILTQPSHDRRRNRGLGLWRLSTAYIPSTAAIVVSSPMPENGKPPIFDDRVFRRPGDPVAQPGGVVLGSRPPPSLLSRVSSVYNSIESTFVQWWIYCSCRYHDYRYGMATEI